MALALLTAEAAFISSRGAGQARWGGSPLLLSPRCSFGPLPIEPGSFANEPDCVLPPTTGQYLDSLSRMSDDGRSLQGMPQRYSSKDWLRNIISVRSDVVFAAVRTQLLWQLAWAVLVSVVYVLFPKIPTLPALPHSLLGGVIGVLLGFRTNQSYE